ncbi:MAG: ferric reductase-like transmembrane domain-containing protein [Candidatus Pacebacteria bacterium]|nr:ferric reductase-like transmembrane domain-containing protein [Candidatus Paceibacterota bacterium]
MITGINPGSFLIALGRLAGLLSEFLILIQLLLISRFSFVEKEYGFDKLADLHRKIGLFLGIFLISHPLLLTFGYAKLNNINFAKQFITFQTGWSGVFTATVAFLIIVITAFISTKAIRNKIKYEVWYFAHLPLYIAVAIAFGHQVNTGDMSQGGAIFYWYLINLVAVGTLVAFRFIKPAYSFFKHSFVIEKIVKENDNVYSIYIAGKKMEQYKFASGQYATLIFLQKNMWFHHPFSFSDSHNGENLRFTVKSSGDFTSKIENLKKGTRVWIDGPLGTFTLEKSINKKYLFIAGGIGITPILSIMKSIEDKKSAILLYSNKRKEEIIFQKEIAESGIETYYFNTDPGVGNRINDQKIAKFCSDYKDRDIYLCGPIQMTSSLMQSIKNNGVSSEQIHFEKFNY